MADYRQKALIAHEKHKGKLATALKVSMKNKDDLSTYYSPGVAAPCEKIAENKEDVYKYTSKGNLVAIISDGTAVLGLGDIGPEASLPVMEGKAALLKAFADIDATAIILDTKDTDEIVAAVKAIAPSFGGINLEDISAPRCFEIEERLIEALDIPVFHDDQHGTAIVTLAGLINALKITGKKKEEINVVISGTGAAGVAILKLLQAYGVKNFIMTDSKGIIYEGRDNLNPAKIEVAAITNREKRQGGVADAVTGADVFIGVSKAGLLKAEMVKSMNSDPIIFAMANPNPEISPEDAKSAGARIIATGRSDYPNQINNVLVFPGIFRGALDARAKKFTTEMKLAAAKALADFVKDPNEERIVPGPFEEGIVETVAAEVKKFA